MLRGHPTLAGALVGLVVTLLCTICFFSLDFVRLMELWTYDWRVRNCNTLLAHESIVHVDIDDNAVELIGRWPWPRDRLAALVRVIGELGAANIFIDLLLSEPQPPYMENPGYSAYAEGAQLGEVMGESSAANEVWPDLELAEALRDVSGTVLSTQLGILAPDQPDPRSRRLRRLYEVDKSLDASRAAAALGPAASVGQPEEIRRDLLRLAMRDRLLADFNLSEVELAAALRVSPSEVSRLIAGVKADVAVEIVAGMFANDAAPSQADVLQRVLGPRADMHSADRIDLEKGWCYQRGLAAVRRSSRASLLPIDNLFYRAATVVPPEYHLAESAAALAAVNFTHDADYAVRRVPPVIAHDGRLIHHLGFAAAARVLGLDSERMTRSTNGELIIPARDGGREYRVPIDDRGQMILPWTATGPQWRQDRDFRHIAIGRLWALVDARRQLRANRIGIDYLLADIVALVKGQVSVATSGAAATTIFVDTHYRRMVNEQLELERRRHRSRLLGSVNAAEDEALAARAAGLQKDIRKEQDGAIAHVRRICRELGDIPAAEIAADAALKKQAEEYRAALRTIEEGVAARVAANRKIEESIRGMVEELRPLISGRQIFIGFAATAQGDIVPTPIDAQTNGVMCHAAMLNAFLQNRFIARAPRGIEMALCAALGAIVSLVTAARSPRAALSATILLIVSYSAIVSYVFFMRRDFWVAIVAPTATMFVVWAFVTLFRQLTAERDRRMFAKQLSQYTSPAIAAKIAESPKAAAAFKTVQTRDVTCYFSDLAGFTTISEKQPPQVVQHVLNTYLERMSRVIWAHRGLINKFMGDGVMAFFNPSVDPMTEHPREACETALATLEELERLKAASAGDPAEEIFKMLEVRIGLASGLVMNGDLGSELKADYTVIGDVVNLAARLEPANKVFGTRIMISGVLRDLVRELYEFRYLAELRVSGKSATVPAYELVCRRGDLDEERRAYIERFEAGVELYKARKWDECIVHFTRILSRRFNDAGASRYIDACQELKQFPPDESWRGALELKEK